MSALRSDPDMDRDAGAIAAGRPKAKQFLSI